MLSEISLRDEITRRRIVIVDNHPLVRRGLAALISTASDLEVCAESDTHRAALEIILVTRPDLVITGLSFGDGIGLALVADIRARNAVLPILVLTIHDSSHWAERVMQAGANGYLSKQELGETLLVAVRTVLDGKNYLGVPSKN